MITNGRWNHSEINMNAAVEDDKWRSIIEGTEQQQRDIHNEHFRSQFEERKSNSPYVDHTHSGHNYPDGLQEVINEVDEALREETNVGTISDFYLEHRMTYGSDEWIERRLGVYGVTAFAAVVGADYFVVFNPDWTDSAALKATYWICIFWEYTYLSFVPLFIFYYILRHISVLDDLLGLKKEVKHMALFNFTVAAGWLAYVHI